jgi:hypothetical protein
MKFKAFKLSIYTKENKSDSMHISNNWRTVTGIQESLTL